MKHIIICLGILLLSSGYAFAQDTPPEEAGTEVSESPQAIKSMKEYIDILEGRSDKQLIDPSQKKITFLKDMTAEEIRAILNNPNINPNRSILQYRLKELEAAEAGEESAEQSTSPKVIHYAE